jgi:hypothetical protein
VIGPDARKGSQRLANCICESKALDAVTSHKEPSAGPRLLRSLSFVAAEESAVHPDDLAALLAADVECRLARLRWVCSGTYNSVGR